MKKRTLLASVIYLGVTALVAVAVQKAVAPGIFESGSEGEGYAVPGRLLAEFPLAEGVVCDLRLIGRTEGCAIEFGVSEWSGDVHVWSDRQTVGLVWFRGEDAIGRQGVRIDAIVPTAVETGQEPGELLVGGTDERGRTKILRLNFDVPAVISGSDGAEAELLSSSELLVVPSSRSLQDILGIHRNLGRPGTFFVRFNSPSDLYLFDPGAPEELELVASPDPESGAPLILPAAFTPMGTYRTREHETHGYVYGFWSFLDALKPNPKNVLIADTNRDGVLDRVLRADTQEALEETGLMDASRYVDSEETRSRAALRERREVVRRATPWGR